MTRTILTTAHFTLTDTAGQKSNVYRDLALVKMRDGGWLVTAGEPDATDDPEGELVSSGMISVPVEAASAFDDLFTLISDPAVVGARTR